MAGATEPVITLRDVTDKTTPSDIPQSCFKEAVSVVLDPGATESDKAHCVLVIRKILSAENAIDGIGGELKGNTDLIKQLLEFCKEALVVKGDGGSPQTSVASDALWALNNISSMESHHTKMVLECGVLDVAIPLVDHRDALLCENSTWMIGNLAGDSAETRDFCLDKGVVPALMRLVAREAGRGLSGFPMSVLRNGVWALRNCCRGKPPPNYSKHFDGVGLIDLLVKLIQHPDDEVVTDALWALSYLADMREATIDIIKNEAALPLLCAFLRVSSAAKVTPAIRAIGGIISNTVRPCLDIEAMHRRTIERLLPAASTTCGTQQEVQTATAASEPLSPMFPAFEHASMRNSKLVAVPCDVWDVVCQFLPSEDVILLPLSSRFVFEHRDAIVWSNLLLRNFPVDRIGEMRNLLGETEVDAETHESNSFYATYTSLIRNNPPRFAQHEFLYRHGALANFQLVALYPKRSIRKEAFWTLSNLLAGNRYDVQAILDAGLLPTILKGMQAPEYEVKKEATFGVANLMDAATPTQVQSVIDGSEAIESLSAILSLYDSRIISVALEALTLMITVFQGSTDESATMQREAVIKKFTSNDKLIDRLAELQSNDNGGVRDKADAILELLGIKEEKEQEQEDRDQKEEEGKN